MIKAILLVAIIVAGAFLVVLRPLDKAIREGWFHG